MKTRDEALPVVQGAKGVHTALKADVQMQVCGFSYVPLKYGKCNVMAGADGEQLMALVARVGEHASKIGTQGFDVRLHAGARAALRPQQPFGELRWARS